jgi:hypothetical protein
VTVYNEQASSHHIFRPNTFGCGNSYEGQNVDHCMGSKHGEVNNTVQARDVNLNGSLCTSYLPMSRANDETSAALNEANQSPFTAKCFSGNFINNGGLSSTSSCSASPNKKGMALDVANKTPVAASICFSAGYGNNIGGSKVNFFGNKNNTVAYQSNMGMRPFSTVESEAYNNNNIRGFAQFSRSFTQIKPNVSSHCSLPESNTLKASNLTKGTDVSLMNGSLVNRNDANCMIDSFVNRHIINNESNMSMGEVMGKI